MIAVMLIDDLTFDGCRDWETVQNIIMGYVFEAPALLACQIDTRVRFETFAPIAVLDSRKLGLMLIIR